MTEMYDVIIAGGGPAGSTTAGLLAKRGRSVLVLEKEAFPRYHIGESMITGMVPIIEELGLRDTLEKEGFRRKYGISLLWGDEPDGAPHLWDVKFAETGSGYDYAWHVKRARLDEILLDRAAELGARVRQQCKVESMERSDDGISTVHYTTADGEKAVARGRWVVDATGHARRLVRNLSTVSHHELLKNIAVWSYWSPCRDLPEGQRGNLVSESVETGWLWGIPVGENEMSVGYVMPSDTYPAGTPKEEVYRDALARSQVVAPLIDGGKMTSEIRTARDWSHTSQPFRGPGWLAVGDCAAFVDPLFSSGVWLAMSGAWLAARALDTVLEHPDKEEQAVGGYAGLYRRLVDDMLAYVTYFYDPTRKREEYFERAQAAVRTAQESSRVGFIALISGIAAVPELISFEPIGENLHVTVPAP